MTDSSDHKQDEDIIIGLTDRERQILFHSKSFLSLLIGDTENALPYLTFNEIEQVANIAGISTFHNANTFISSFSSRTEYLEHVFSSSTPLSQGDKVISIILSKRSICTHSLAYNSEELLDLNTNQKIKLIDQITSDAISGFINQLNDIVVLDNLQVRYDFSTQKLIFSKLTDTDVFVKNTIMNFGFLKELYETGLQSLNMKDYLSVITKSRTILEKTFITILQQYDVSFKDNGKISSYRGKVNKILGMNPDGDNWNKKDTRLKDLRNVISGLNKIIDSIANFRDKNSDSHAGKQDPLPIKKAEAELMLNSAVTVSSYYLEINERHKSS